MIDVELDSNKKFQSNSDIIKVEQDKMYKVTTKVTGYESKPFSAYFGVIILNKNNKEAERKIKWLNDISGNEKTVSIIFNATTQKILFVYRINLETPVKSKCKYKILPVGEVSISEEDSKKEDYLKTDDFVLEGLPELTPNQELSLEKNIVWLFGSTRGGTTWVGTQLLSHQTQMMFEPRFAYFFGEQRLWVNENGKKINKQSQNPDYFFSDATKNSWKFYLRKLILNRIQSQFPDFSHKIIMKENLDRGGSDIISECFPNSKIIILIRDGRDVIDSKIDARHNKNSWGVKRKLSKPLRQEERSAFISSSSRKWVELIDDLMRTYNNHPKKLRILVRYEDLLKNTSQELKKIYDFLQIEINNEDLEKLVSKYSFENIPKESKGKGKFTRFATPGKWKENFNLKEKNLMKSIMGKTLSELNYSQ